MQDELRKRLLEIRKEYGTTFSFIAKELNIHRATISLFVAGKRNLPKVVQTKLEKLLDETFPKNEEV